MQDDTTAFVGLDVHKEAIAIAVAEPGRAPARFLGTVPPALAPLKKGLAHLGCPARVLIVYEAGPCGYGLARRLLELGYRCEVVAPGKIPQRPGERIKTDRRDALSLASFARSAELTPVLIPDECDEAMRDLARAREDAVRARLKARQQLKAMLLRHGHPYSGRIFWSAAHQRDLAKVSFPHPAQQIAFTEYQLAVTEADERVARLSTALREQVATWRLQPMLSALMTLRGLEFLTAATGGAGGSAPLPSPQAADVFSRAGAQRILQWSVPPLGCDHQVWQCTCPPRVDRSSLGLSLSRPPQSGLADPPARPAKSRARYRLEGPTAAVRSLSPHAEARLASKQNLYRHCPRDLCLHLGYR